MKQKKFTLNSIRTKLIISFLSVCLIPLIILGSISLAQSTSILDKKLQLTSTQTLSQVNSSLNNYFSGMNSMTSIMSNNYSFLHMSEANNLSSAEELLKSIKESHADILNTYVGTEEGKFYINPSQKLPDDFNPTQRPWYINAKSNPDKVVTTLPYKDASSGKLVVSTAKAIQNNGKILGVVAIDISVDTLIKDISTSKIGSSGYIFTADMDGNVIAHPDQALIGTNAIGKQSYWNEIKSKDSGYLPVTVGGQKQFLVYQTNKITGWKTVAVMAHSELTADTNSIMSTTLIMIGIMLIIGIAASWVLSKGIAENIKKLKEVCAKVSKGDFTVSVETKAKDEFKDLINDFNLMISNISSLMKKIKKSSETVLETSSNLASMSEETTASVEEVTRAINEVSMGAVSQAENAQEGVAKIHELSSTLDIITKNNADMNKLSLSTESLSSEGLAKVKDLIEKSDRTKASTDQVSKIISDMDSSTAKINSISETISDITEQTNLLSLNASIEAARAGEAGKGFAVVADEIRKLAEQSKDSTEEIKSIIENIKSRSEIAVMAIEDAGNIVIEQEVAVKETQEIFNKIIEAISSITSLIGDMRSSVINVDSKKEDVQTEIENISSVCEQTASASQEVTASAEEINATMDEFTTYAQNLQTLSEQLEEELNKFKI
ncbi:methyl-accepting chemotaxis protein [Clostridium sp. TW13]|uniref:Methyl-accepting chemotaxis protein n=2 Tax=Inconstantimicrobium mannanitabidum TaxID=1604901 RepID=A0ACB5RAF7_9CLOT|nr:methyl-accepting chemotaxis protein [Clostridium sp. TW13]